MNFKNSFSAITIELTSYVITVNRQLIFFLLPNEISIGHCISQCLTVSEGIALQFRNKFNNIKILIGQKKKYY